MKKLLLLLAIFFLINWGKVFAQYSGSFVVQGDLGKYYPVIFSDASWSNNKATEFEIGRSSIHTDVLWRGSLIAKFRVHTTDWGNGSYFIDADIRQFDPYNGKYFVAGWSDITIGNNDQAVIIWLQGGSTTYYFNSPVNINPVVYDGVQNALPYQVTNGPAVTYLTNIQPYVNSNGLNSGGSAYYAGGTDNYFAGYVGLGTTDPVAALDVRNGAIHVVGGFGADYSNQGAYTGWNGSGGGGETNFTNNIGGGVTGGFTFDNVSLSNVSSRLMSILGNGNVGIGTPSPSSTLAITPVSMGLSNMSNTFIAGSVSKLPDVAGSYLYPFEFQHTNSQNTDRLQFAPYRRVAGPYWMGTAYRIQFAVDNSFTDGSKAYVEIGSSDPNSSGGGLIAFGTEGTDRMAITSAGNIGIGCIDTKGYKFAVAGNAIAESMTVKLQANWPDYTFKKDYILMPLSQVKTYIDKNQHLPDIPSATEVEKDGVNLGEMNRLLVKKVEELTLYLIEKDKQVNNLTDKLQVEDDRLKKLEQQMEALHK